MALPTVEARESAAKLAAKAARRWSAPVLSARNGALGTNTCAMATPLIAEAIRSGSGAASQAMSANEAPRTRVAPIRQRRAPGHAASETLKANGVEVVFGLNGDHVLQLYDGLADLGGITHVTVKHENNAALAAEAYGRLTGRPGVALVTAGPGALNSISGVASAMASGAPLVSLTGAVPSSSALETFHGVDEVDFTERAFAPIAKSSRRVTRAGDIQGALTDAFALAVDGRPGPTHVEVTRDVLEGDPFDAAQPAPAP